MSGTTGNDTLSLDNLANLVDLLAGNDSVLGNGGNDTLIGNIGNDTLRGGDDNDSLLGSAGNDSIAGDAGDDWIEGGLGTDTLDGGAGTDTLSYANDTIGVGINLGNNGRDAVTNGGNANSESRPGNSNSRDNIISASFEAVVGGSGNDTLVGDNDAEYLAGNAGKDSLVGNGGNDTIDGGSGNDVISGGGGNDVIRGGDGDDHIAGGTGNDTIEGGAGADAFVETGGTDGGIDELSYASDTAGVNVNLATGAVSGGHAQGDVFSGNQFENLRGGSGNDTLTGTTHRDNQLFGGAGDDSIETNLGDSAFGEAGNDTIIGSTEFGSGNEDYLDGGEGNDFIWGKGGADTIRTGAGDDTVRVTLNVAGDPSVDSLDGGTEDGRDVLDIQDWTGPASFGTDDLASGTYGNWTVGGDPGTNAERFFTHTSGTSFRARDFEGIVCFAEGTLIATARGEVPVETLRAGDLVLTAHAGAALQPLIWVGHTTIDVARHPNKAKVAPVMIKAGALAEGVPFRDLRVSPDHAVFLDGRLVPAALLVNGTTIIQETWCRRVTYWHAELAHHGLLVSEGAVTESYFDDGNRHLFDNAGIAAFAVDFAAHRPNGRYAGAACAPVAAEGDAVLERIRARLAARAPARRAMA